MKVLVTETGLSFTLLTITYNMQKYKTAATVLLGPTIITNINLTMHDPFYTAASLIW